MRAVEISEGSGLSVSVRKGKVETIEQNQDKGMGVTVYLGQTARQCQHLRLLASSR